MQHTNRVIIFLLFFFGFIFYCQPLSDDRNKTSRQMARSASIHRATEPLPRLVITRKLQTVQCVSFCSIHAIDILDRTNKTFSYDTTVTAAVHFSSFKLLKGLSIRVKFKQVLCVGQIYKHAYEKTRLLSSHDQVGTGS